jgi:hypothetical protein
VPDLGRALAGAAKDSVGRHRAITLSRYALLVESANNPGLRAHIAAGGRVNIWIANWLRMAGSTEGSARWTAGFPRSAARNRIREQAGIVGSPAAAPTSPVS